MSNANSGQWMLRRIIIIAVSVLAALALIIVAINAILVENDMVGCSEPGPDMCSGADAIVAVSGGDTVARANKAIAMYKSGWADKLVFSGDSADPKSISNAEAMRRIAIDNDVPADAIYTDESSQDTRENAKNTVEILHSIDAHNVILVSSPYHLRRVKMNFIAVDSAINYRTAAADDQYWQHWYLTPNGWIIAAKELAGIAQLSAEVQ